ncbi:MAG: hypothetical protein BWY85_02353 [Firmicutes bacterium ADurb.Bin506]|nr:MAG: hypothetical protein BWY85_02353 [Firmicutes bacterium ADurb.Bin506]
MLAAPPAATVPRAMVPSRAKVSMVASAMRTLFIVATSLNMDWIGIQLQLGRLGSCAARGLIALATRGWGNKKPVPAKGRVHTRGATLVWASMSPERKARHMFAHLIQSTANLTA